MRTPENNYQLVFGNQGLGPIVAATLNFDRQGAAKIIDDPPDGFSELLVAARIDKVEPILYDVLGTQFRVFGTAIAVEDAPEDFNPELFPY